jgi:hypothetical protein
MEAPARYYSAEAWQADHWRPDRASLALPAALALVGLLLGSATLLIARRSAGALVDPLSAGWLIVLGGCVAATVVSARYFTVRAISPAARSVSLILHWGPTLAVAMFVVALAIKGTSLSALIFYVGIMVGAEFFAERGVGLFGKPRAEAVVPNRVRKTMPAGDDKQQVDRTHPAELFSRPSELNAIGVETSQQIDTESAGWEVPRSTEDLIEIPEVLLEGAWQQITRARTPEGEMITGWVKAEFQPGERTAVLHVAFCPPLAVAPEFEIEQLSGPGARIKAAQVLPQGTRLEIRLNTPATEPETLLLAFVGTEPFSEA